MHETLVKILRQKRNRPLPLEGYTPSAVLVPLFFKRGAYHLLFTLRSWKVKDHKGQISFPGGVQEQQDKSLLETALRETYEEIGLEPQRISVLGELGNIYTPTHYRISPFVGLIPYPFSFRLNHREIDGLIEVPVNHLLNPRNLKVERLEFFHRRFDSPFFHYKKYTIWGATGKITRELMDLWRRDAKRRYGA